MDVSSAVREAIGAARARVRVGYPWWLRPWLARGVVAITLGRRIYVSGQAAGGPRQFLDRLMRHELAHVAQVDRLGLLRFLGKYLAEFARHYWRVRSFSRAYRMISFEVEATAAEEPIIEGPLTPR